MKFGKETHAVYREVIDHMASLADKFEAAQEDGRLADEQSALESYRWAFSILQVANDVYLWGDPRRPRFVDIVGPYKKWGGDNSDAYYQFFPPDPNRNYRITGTRGDSVYFSLTVYGGPDDGNYSDRLLFTINDRDLELDDQGRFEFLIGPKRPDGYTGAFGLLEPDAVAACTRDYMVDPKAGQRVSWNIECLDDPGEYRVTDADLARRLRAVLTWLRDQSSMVPTPLGDPNTLSDPYPVAKVTRGWAAGDASYARGAFALAEDEALCMTGTFPECAFWNVCLWNPYLHTFNYDYERVTLNVGEAVANADGSVTVVVAHRDPGHPNWISPQGHPSGTLWWRWFLPEKTPEPLTLEHVKVSEVVDATPS